MRNCKSTCSEPDGKIGFSPLAKLDSKSNSHELFWSLCGSVEGFTRSKELLFSARFRQRKSGAQAEATFSGSREFHPASAPRTFTTAVERVNGGKGGRDGIDFSSPFLTVIGPPSTIRRAKAISKSSSEQRRQLPAKGDAETMPSPRIWKLHMQAGPLCAGLGSSYVVPNRSNHGDDNLRTKLSKPTSQTRFASLADALSRAGGHPVHRFSAQVHQVTTHGAKRFQEFIF